MISPFSPNTMGEKGEAMLLLLPVVCGPFAASIMYSVVDSEADGAELTRWLELGPFGTTGGAVCRPGVASPWAARRADMEPELMPLGILVEPGTTVEPKVIASVLEEVFELLGDFRPARAGAEVAGVTGIAVEASEVQPFSSPLASAFCILPTTTLKLRRILSVRQSDGPA